MQVDRGEPQGDLKGNTSHTKNELSCKSEVMTGAKKVSPKEKINFWRGMSTMRLEMIVESDISDIFLHVTAVLINAKMK